MKMVTSSALETTMTLKQSYVPKSLPKVFEDLSKNDNTEAKLMILNDYLLKHQEELSSIEYYRDKLPQCNLLLHDAIEAIKMEIKRLKKGKEAQQGRTSTDALLAKKGGFEQEPRAHFMSPSAQQWNNPNQDKGQKTTKSITLQAEQESGLLPDSSLRIQVGQFGSGAGTNNQFVANPKPMRLSLQSNNRLIWTVGLHERFEEALRYLGGHQVATPKRIREYMKVEGLTINQVKSHLQKYRLHKKKSAFTSGELEMHAIASVDACNDVGGPRAGRDSGIGLEDLRLKVLQHWLNE